MGQEDKEVSDCRLLLWDMHRLLPGSLVNECQWHEAHLE